jgi:hypothetical protein
VRNLQLSDECHQVAVPSQKQNEVLPTANRERSMVVSF